MGKFTYETLFSNTTLFIVISPVLLMAIVLSLYKHPAIWLIKNKRNSSSGKELTFTIDRSTLIRSIVTWSFLGVYFILMIFAGSDCFTNPFKVILAFIPIISGIFIGKYFVTVNIEYYESLGRKAKDHEIMMVRTTYIQCRNKDIAEMDI